MKNIFIILFTAVILSNCESKNKFNSIESIAKICMVDYIKAEKFATMRYKYNGVFYEPIFFEFNKSYDLKKIKNANSDYINSLTAYKLNHKEPNIIFIEIKDNNGNNISFIKLKPL